MNEEASKELLSSYADFYGICVEVFDDMYANTDKDGHKYKFITQWMKFYNSAVIGTRPDDPDFLDFIRIAIHEMLSYLTRFAEMEEQRNWYIKEGIPLLKKAFGPMLEPLGHDIFPSYPRKPIPYDPKETEKYGQSSDEMLSLIDGAMNKDVEGDEWN